MTLLRRVVSLTLIKRDGEDQMDGGDDERTLRFSASSETPVMRGGDAEILLHGESNVRLDRLRSLGTALINHDSNQRCAAIRSANLANGRLEVSVAFGTSDLAEQARRDVKDGLLRGVSIGYRVHSWDVNEDSRTYTATDWEPYEVSFTPVPADASVGVGRAVDDEAWRQAIPNPINPRAAMPSEGKPMNFDQWLTARGVNPANLNDAQRAALRADFDAIQRASQPSPAPVAAPAPAPASAPAIADEGQRARAIAEAREITAMAEEHHLRASDYIGMPKPEAAEKMLRAVAERNATRPPSSPVVNVTNLVDAADKARDAAVGAILAGAGFRGGKLESIQRGNEMVGRGLSDIVRGTAEALGMRDSYRWSREDVAWFALGKPEMMSETTARSVRSAANVTSGSFPTFVFLTAVTKAVINGYERRADSSNYRKLLGKNPVKDFRQFSIGALGMSNLIKTAEDVAFPELDKSDGVYNSTVKMWGGTMSLTLQALVNDDTGQFMRHLGMAGAIADKTIEKRAFQKLLMGTSTSEAASTWTGNTTSGCSPVFTTADTLAAARGKVSTGMVALMNKTGLDNNPLGTMPRYIVAGPTSGQFISALIAPVYGQAAGNGFANMAEPVISPWLEASALMGNSTTTFYVLGDPALVDGLLLSEIPGFENIQVQPFDAGATASLNWKLWKPFEVDLPFLSINSTNVIAAAQQCTT